MYGVIDAVGKMALISKTKRQPLMTAPTQKSYWLVPLFWLIFFTTMIMRGPHNVVGPMAQEVCDFYGMTSSISTKTVHRVPQSSSYGVNIFNILTP